VAGFSGDGSQATQAKLNCPFAVTTDDDGNLYIADLFNNRVRMVDRAGIITTIAGTGQGIDTGDGGLAAEASLLAPAEVLFDATRGLLVASGAYIRRIGTDGVITTIAGLGAGPQAGYGIERWTDAQDGAPAIDAAFSDAGGMTLAPDGSLYFADFGDDRVFMIDGEGLIHRVAGIGSTSEMGIRTGDGGPATQAGLRRPADVALGPDGSLYILEHFGNIRRVRPDGTIETVDIGHTYDQAQGVVADDRYLYIADREGAVVLRVEFSAID
jgi:DNA-binding beta-propeller fold protein YncE